MSKLNKKQLDSFVDIIISWYFRWKYHDIF